MLCLHTECNSKFELFFNNEFWFKSAQNFNKSKEAGSNLVIRGAGAKKQNSLLFQVYSEGRMMLKNEQAGAVL